MCAVAVVMTAPNCLCVLHRQIALIIFEDAQALITFHEPKERRLTFSPKPDRLYLVNNFFTADPASAPLSFCVSEKAKTTFSLLIFLQQGVVAELPHILSFSRQDLQDPLSYLLGLQTQEQKAESSMQSSREKKLVFEQSIYNTAVLSNSSPVGLSGWFTGRDVEWIGTSVMIGYHPHFESFIFAHLSDSNQVAYSVTSQLGQTIKLEESPDDNRLCIELLEPFCDVAESDTFDITAITRMKALVYYFMIERGVLEELNVYDGIWNDLNDAITAHHKAHERISTTKQSQRTWSPSYQPRRYCIVSARIFLDRLADDQRSALIIATSPATESPSASTLESSPVSAAATSSKRPYSCINEFAETPAKRTQTGFTQTSPENRLTDHVEIMRSYAEKMLAECDQFSRERTAYETQLQTNNTLISELEDLVTSHSISIAAAQASYEEANRKHAAEIDIYAEKIKMFQVDTKALNGRVNELLTANEHMRQMEKDHEEILQEETARANKAARAKLYERLGKDMLLVAKGEARGLEQE